MIIKRILIAVLAVCLCLTMLPVVAMEAKAADSVNMMILYAQDRVGKTGQQLGYTDQWCAFFVCDCAVYAGQSEAIPYNGNAHSLYFAVLSAGGSVVSSPQAGDLVFYNCVACDTNNDGISIMHVGLVENENYSIEGNLDGSSYATRSVKRKALTASYSHSSSHSTSNYVKRIYVRPNYKVTTDKPSKPLVQVSKTTYNIGQPVIAFWDDVPSVTNYWIDIWSNGEHLVSESVGLATSYTYMPDKIGEYSIYITAVNSAGKTLSDACQFQIKAFQTDVSVKTKNHTVTVSWTDVGASSYYMYVYRLKDGTVPYGANQGKQLTCNLLLDSGEYIAYVTAVYSPEIMVSSSFKFTIYDYYATTNKGLNASYGKNEEVTVSVNAEDGEYTKCYYVLYHTSDNGIRTLLEQNTIDSNNYSKTFSRLGKYECSFGVHSKYGYTESAYVTWYIKEKFTIAYDANGGSGAPDNQMKLNGENLTISNQIPSRNGYIFLGWALNADSEVVEYQPGDTFGENMDTTLYAIWTSDVTPPSITSWNISLADNISMNFCVFVDDVDVEKAIVEIEIGDQTVSYPVIDSNTAEDTGEYMFTVKLTAAQMNDIVTVRTIADGKIIEEKNYTVRQYCDTILADDSHSQYHALVKEMLNYGAMAQLYFGYDTENLANDGISGTAATEVPETADEMIFNDKISSLSFYGASLVYRDKIAVRYYFTGDVTGKTFTANGNTHTPVAKDDMYYVEIADILPQDLDQQITLTVTDADGNTLTVTYGPLNYIVRMNQKNDENLQNLLKALYNYHLAAKAL